MTKPSQDELILMAIDNIYNKVSQLNDKIECVLLTLCDQDSDATFEAIRIFHESDFRNRRKI